MLIHIKLYMYQINALKDLEDYERHWNKKYSGNNKISRSV